MHKKIIIAIPSNTQDGKNEQNNRDASNDVPSY